MKNRLGRVVAAFRRTSINGNAPPRHGMVRLELENGGTNGVDGINPAGPNHRLNPCRRKDL